MTALYNPRTLNGAFRALWISLQNKTSRAAIMSVMRTLSATEIEYGTPILMAVECQMVQPGCEV